MISLKFIMLVGLPASGKSHFAKKYAEKYDAVIHSSDALRQEMFGDENHQEDNDKLFQELFKRTKKDLSNGKSVIFDACNINSKRRRTLLRELERFDMEKHCYIIAKPYDDCIRDNRNRERSVPDFVIKKMRESFWCPMFCEGWDEIYIEYVGEKSAHDPFIEIVKKCEGFNQENKHHTLTLDKHMIKVSKFLANESAELKLAGRYHDIGKLYTKTFKKRDNTIDENAHYYGHESVGAYEFLIAGCAIEMLKIPLLKICSLINFHMRAYDFDSDSGKGKSKFIELVGQEFFDDLMKLHAADKLAH